MPVADKAKLQCSLPPFLTHSPREQALQHRQQGLAADAPGSFPVPSLGGEVDEQGRKLASPQQELW